MSNQSDSQNNLHKVAQTASKIDANSKQAKENKEGMRDSHGNFVKFDEKPIDWGSMQF